MYQTIIFDFDGTIADTFSIFCDTAKEMGEEIGIENLTEEDIKEYRQEGVKKFLKDRKRILKGLKIFPWRIPFLIKKGRKMFKNKMGAAKPFEEIPPIIRIMFERKVKLGIITTNSKESVEEFLHKYDLEVFDFITSAPSLFGKAAVIRETLAKYRLGKDNVVYVGDELRDVEAAKNAGIKVAAVTWGYNDKELLESAEPDYVFEKPEELLNLIR